MTWWRARPTWQKVVLIVLVVAVLGAAFGGEETDEPVTALVATTRAVEVTTTTQAPTTTQVEIAVSLSNAIESARSYLDYTAFSRSGLIAQLEYEEYSTEDATAAVDSLDVDWNEQAALMAQDYLDYSSFSRGGLVEQLEFEGFTTEQAEYGVTAVGL